jgi:GWxTD domain-containing protein
MSFHRKIGLLTCHVPLILFFIILFAGSIEGQTNFSEEYRKGVEALSKNQVFEAEDYFKESIIKNKDAGSFYRLGKLQKDKNTHNSRNDALDNLKQAAYREPENITYRLEYALLLEDFAIHSAVNEYKDIVSEFPKCAQAFVRLGEIKLKDYNEYKDSKKIGKEDDAKYDFNMAEIVKTDFNEAEEYFLSALRIDSLNENAFYGLGRLYENSGNEKKAIFFLNKMASLNPANKNVHLFLGMLYHRQGNDNRASTEFGKALDLMSLAEKEDFVYNSVSLLTAEVYGDEINHLNRNELELTFEKFWKASNPLLLSEKNERLLEHYSRMAYANLYFSVPKSGIEGWKTHRGEVLLRYGLPKVRTKTRPHIDGNGGYSSKNETWVYDDFTLSFDDYSMNGDYKLSWDRGGGGRFSSSLRSNTASFETFELVKKDIIQRYEPKRKQFEVNKEIYCFKSFDEDKRRGYDSYLAFELPIRDSLGRINRLFPKYETGIFMFDSDFNPLFEKKTNYNKERVGKILVDKMNYDKVDNLKVDIPSATVSFAFEVRRLSDSSFYSYHSLIEGPEFKTGSLDVSDLMLASAVEANKEIPGAILRNDLYVVPKVRLQFRNDETIFLYYEAYNLLKRTDGLSDFEQVITIKEHADRESESGIASFFRGVKEFIFGADSKISMSALYRTKEKDAQQYIQLDFSKQPAGSYDLILEVIDRVNGKRIEKKLMFEITGEKK